MVGVGLRSDCCVWMAVRMAPSCSSVLFFSAPVVRLYSATDRLTGESLHNLPLTLVTCLKGHRSTTLRSRMQLILIFVLFPPVCPRRPISGRPHADPSIRPLPLSPCSTWPPHNPAAPPPLRLPNSERPNRDASGVGQSAPPIPRIGHSLASRTRGDLAKAAG